MEHNHQVKKDNPKSNHAEQGEHGGSHTSHHEMMARDFKKRFFISLIFGIPVFLLSPTIQDWFGYVIPGYPGDKLVLLALASVVVIWGGRPFFTEALREIKYKNYGMMTLVSVAVLSGYLFSVGTTFFFAAPDFYWEIATLVIILLLGHWMEMRAVLRTGNALSELVKLIPPKANLVKGADTVLVPTDKLKIGDVIKVRPGEKVPIDGEVISGESSLNEALISGESKPVRKKVGEQVLGGTLNTDGVLDVRVTKVGSDTALSQIINLVTRAQETKPPTEKVADKAAKYLTLTALGVGALTFIFWSVFTGQGVLFALTLTITVVVITCPHALGLAIPTVTTIATSIASKNGVLIRDMLGIEAAEKVDYIVFDKTGTLTEGRFGVTDIKTTPAIDENELIRVAASLEKNSEHTIAQGIVRQAADSKFDLQNVSKFKSVAGQGVTGWIGEEQYLIGSKAFMQDQGIKTSNFDKDFSSWSEQGKTVVGVSKGKELIGLIALTDTIKDDAKKAVAQLQQLGYKIAMLTGDNKKVAKYVASELKIDSFFAEVLPEDKVKKVKQLQAEGNKVMMVGDGVNDAPALTQADVGVAIGAGTDVAQESAELILAKNNPRDIVKIIRLSKRTVSKMRQNLVWATGYNVIAIPLAAGVLYSAGIVLRPEWGAIAMSASTVVVVINALMLKRADSYIKG